MYRSGRFGHQKIVGNLNLGPLTVLPQCFVLPRSSVLPTWWRRNRHSNICRHIYTLRTNRRTFVSHMTTVPICVFRCVHTAAQGHDSFVFRVRNPDDVVSLGRGGEGVRSGGLLMLLRRVLLYQRLRMCDVVTSGMPYGSPQTRPLAPLANPFPLMRTV